MLGWSSEEVRMYARVAVFENPDLSRIDELMATVGERARAGGDMPGARRVIALVDREAGRILGITLFESEEAIREAEPRFEQMGDEIPESLRGKRAAVEIYEVAIDDVADGARAARVSSLEGSPEKIDEGLEFIKGQIMPMLSDISGARGALGLVDRASGRTKTITFWDGIESLQASEERATELRSEAAAAMAETITGVDRYEIALIESLTPAVA
jgi:hypothetical protein